MAGAYCIAAGARLLAHCHPDLGPAKLIGVDHEVTRCCQAVGLGGCSLRGADAAGAAQYIKVDGQIG